MDGAGPAIAIRHGVQAPALPRAMDRLAIPPTLIRREAVPRRTKIWEFSNHLHCSIIGTCLSSAELRQTLRRCGVGSDGCSDHDLHSLGVTLAGRHDDAGRRLHKALDQRHRLAISQFAKAESEAAVGALWRDGLRRGDIPGAYWAALTHPLATPALVREAFAEVHMLSHLVGAANRADIRRLCVLETEKAALEAKLQRQQVALHGAVVTRDTQIRALRQALQQRIVDDARSGVSDDGAAALRDLAGDLQRRLAAETRRRLAVEARLAAAQGEAARERSGRVEGERALAAMRRELTAIEASLVAPAEADAAAAPVAELGGLTVLYVGGRPNQIAAMRVAVERMGARLLHHDGGVEDRSHLLPGLASRADVVLFPVDCISHDAAHAVKVLCRQSDKRFVALRSASVTSLLAALQAPDLMRMADAAV